MVMEVCCGQCNARLLVDTPGVVVACPHCGVHLSVPLPDDDSKAAGELPTTPSVPDPATNAQHVSGNAIVKDSIPSNSPIEATQTPVASNPAQSIATTPVPTSSIFGGLEDEEPGSNQSSKASAAGSPNVEVTGAAPAIGTQPSPLKHRLLQTGRPGHASSFQDRFS